MGEHAALRVSLVIPTYRRPRELARCLAGVARLAPGPCEVIVARHASDDETRAVVATCEVPARDVVVTERGAVVQMLAGARHATGDVVAFTDDDAVPRPDWLAWLLWPYTDPSVGGVGGRDVVHRPDGEVVAAAPRARVGEVSRWGRVLGHHHVGAGAPRAVSMLKGVNCSYRRDILELPLGLRGVGAPVGHELATGLRVLARGYRLVYEPEALVDHYPGRRFDDDDRAGPSATAAVNATYNETLAVGSVRPDLRHRRLAYMIVAGDRRSPGVVRSLMARARGEVGVKGRFIASARTTIEATRDARRRPLSLVRVADAEVPARPRVALVAHAINDGGGMERACAELIRQLHTEVRFVVVAIDLAPELVPLVDRWVRVRAPRRPFLLRYPMFYVVASAALRRVRADLVHTVGAVVPNRVDVAAVHLCHAATRAAGVRRQERGRARRLSQTVVRAVALATERWSYRSARVRCLTTVSAGSADELARHYPGVPIVVVPNGVDRQRFRPDPAVRARTRTRGHVTDQVVALFVGGDWGRKGLGIAIEAVAKARSEGADLVLWVVGRGDRGAAEALAEERGVVESVTFFGQQCDPERFYQAADVFVLPSMHETFSLACFEAASCGLPLVVTGIPTAATLVGDGDAGVVVERSPGAVADALVLLADPGPRRRMGTAARLRVAGFTWDANAAATASLYRDLLRPRGNEL